MMEAFSEALEYQNLLVFNIWVPEFISQIELELVQIKTAQPNNSSRNLIYFKELLIYRIINSLKYIKLH